MQNKTSICFKIFLVILLFLLLLVPLFALGNSDTRVVLLSFDVEPVDDKDSVLDIIDILESANINATFFVTGKYAELYPDVVDRLAPFEIGCHSYNHPQLNRLSLEEQRKEIITSKEILERISGQEIIGFRAPYNLANSDTYNVLDDLGFVYDATRVYDWQLFMSRPSDSSHLVNIPISSAFGIPFEDVVWLYYTRGLGKNTYFFLMKHRRNAVESYDFHPHHIIKEKDEFIKLINHLKDDNVIFISHSQLANSHGG